jgi:putative heme-binding domain-containing protein
MAEHGPHAIELGPDGAFYLLYGNHAEPRAAIDPASPARDLREDQLLERYVDPRGHATNIRAPGGSLFRLTRDLRGWRRVAAGMRNAYDFDFNSGGEIFTVDSDMEWDDGMPWYRPVAVLHLVPGGDYGWRTGSGKFPRYAIDTLPAAAEIGRGSPVGVAFYHHRVYPERYWGAYFNGDWSRGRIRVYFPRADGTGFGGAVEDFVVGAPLNVTDLDVGPDGHLYFVTGGRRTTGGLYRVRYTDELQSAPSADDLEAALAQPMARSAWGRAAIERIKERMGEAWAGALREAALDGARPDEQRVAAIERLALHGPAPDLEFLRRAASSDSAPVRSASIRLMADFQFAEIQDDLIRALLDEDPVVVRRASEAAVAAGLAADSDPSTIDAAFVDALFDRLDSPDRFVRHAARRAVTRLPRSLWIERAASDSPERRPRGAMESLLALVLAQSDPSDVALIREGLIARGAAATDDKTLLDYARVAQLALLRSPAAFAEDLKGALAEIVAPGLAARLPHNDSRANRELQTLLAALDVAEAIDPMLDTLESDAPQEDQIHAVYALRAMQNGWTPERRERLTAWFDRAAEFRGAASLEGYLNLLWEDCVELLTDEERARAEARRDERRAERSRRMAAWLADPADAPTAPGELSRMTFEELADYVDLNPTGREGGNIERGRRVFHRARCADCHLFGDEGRGGGPDLSTAVARFTRREMLESVMFPSRVISDRYAAVDVRLTTGGVESGMLASESESGVTLIRATGEKIEIPADRIAERTPSSLSIMPEGLIDWMSLRELTDLFAFLESGG